MHARKSKTHQKPPADFSETPLDTITLTPPNIANFPIQRKSFVAIKKKARRKRSELVITAKLQTIDENKIIILLKL